MENNITTIDKPRCSRCGKFKPIEELNGYNPIAPVGQKYKNAYCVKLTECDSEEAMALLESILRDLEE